MVSVYAGGRGVSSRVFENVGGNYIRELRADPDYPDNPNYYFIYPSYQPEGTRRYKFLINKFSLLAFMYSTLCVALCSLCVDTIGQGNYYEHFLHPRRPQHISYGFSQTMKDSFFSEQVQTSTV